LAILVDSRLSLVEMGRRDPFGVAMGVIAGGPAAGFDQGVIGAAGQRAAIVSSSVISEASY
jgi:hypothetical protein